MNVCLVVFLHMFSPALRLHQTRVDNNFSGEVKGRLICCEKLLNDSVTSLHNDAKLCHLSVCACVWEFVCE